ncbi:hypothetical protein R1flu_018724 [Riccia fluitans]|uniref:Uncharacterized protein n=1 Tax=Riccia fluitans TaxID=41844 RepID=A0ABD1ZGM9_9MARC
MRSGACEARVCEVVVLADFRSDPPLFKNGGPIRSRRKKFSKLPMSIGSPSLGRGRWRTRPPIDTRCVELGTWDSPPRNPRASQAAEAEQKFAKGKGKDCRTQSAIGKKLKEAVHSEDLEDSEIDWRNWKRVIVFVGFVRPSFLTREGGGGGAGGSSMHSQADDFKVIEYFVRSASNSLYRLFWRIGVSLITSRWRSTSAVPSLCMLQVFVFFCCFDKGRFANVLLAWPPSALRRAFPFWAGFPPCRSDISLLALLLMIPPSVCSVVPHIDMAGVNDLFVSGLLATLGAPTVPHAGFIIASFCTLTPERFIFSFALDYRSIGHVRNPFHLWFLTWHSMPREAQLPFSDVGLSKVCPGLHPLSFLDFARLAAEVCFRDSLVSFTAYPGLVFSRVCPGSTIRPCGVTSVFPSLTFRDSVRPLPYADCHRVLPSWFQTT